MTLDPGLEVDPAISPDGKFIAYAAGPTSAMKLFVRQLEGGNTIPISRDLTGNLRRPLWSPDGARIAFQSPRGIEIVTALGGIPKLLVGADGGESPHRLCLVPGWPAHRVSASGHPVHQSIGRRDITTGRNRL